MAQEDVNILTKSAIVEACAIGERLALAVTDLLAVVGPQHRRPFTLSRFLGADGTSCQRLVSCVTVVDASTLAKAPGPKAIRRIADTLEPAGLEPSLAQSFRDVAERFEAFLQAVGGNQAKYRERLLLTQARARTAEDGHSTTDAIAAPIHAPAVHRGADASRNATASQDEINRDHFDSSCRLVGRWSEVNVHLRVLRPSPGLVDAADLINVAGHVGMTEQSPQTPFVFTYHRNQAETTTGAKPLSPRGEYLLPEFTSPWLKVTTSMDGPKQINLIELAASRSQRPADLMHGNVTHGIEMSRSSEFPDVNEFFSILAVPTRRLICDIFLHTDLARKCKSGADVHLLREPPNTPGRSHSRWMTRLGQPLQLSFLGTGVVGVDTDAYMRHTALVDHVFKSQQWDPRDYVGFRLDVHYPIWRAAYRVHFEFGV